MTTEPAPAASGTATADPVVLDVRGVTVRFGGVVAVNDVSLQAPAGSITGLIGPNGAGKTTLFNVVTGLQAASAGQVLLGGEDITRLGPTRRARRGVGRTFQRLEVFGSMTAYDNVLTAAEFRRGWSDDHVDPQEETAQVLERVGLAEVAARRADTLSTGLAWICSAVPDAMCEPWSRTCTVAQFDMTRSMSCSTSRIAIPSSVRLPSSATRCSHS